MSILSTLKLFLAVLPVPIALDFIWLGLVMSPFYRRELGGIMGDLRYGPAGVVYLLITLGIVFFVLPRADSWETAGFYGALLGLVTYGVYDFTNMATLTAWTWKIVAVDVGWGMVVCGLSSMAAFALRNFLR